MTSAIGQSKRGAEHPRYTGGVSVNSDGYLVIKAGPLRGLYVHRLVLEAKLGRPIGEGMEAHHINGDRLDARPANLEERAVEEHRPLLNGRPRWRKKR